MPKQILAALLVLSSILTACGGASTNKAENAGMAMAETACLLFDESISLEDIPTMTTDIVEKYGFITSDNIDTYLAEIAGTEELNEVAVAVREHLEATCGDALEASGLSAADLSEAIVLE